MLVVVLDELGKHLYKWISFMYMKITYFFHIIGRKYNETRVGSDSETITGLH